MKEFISPSELEPLDLESLKVGDVIRTYTNGRAFRYLGRGRYALNCQITMHRFENMFDTDAPSGTEWFLEEDVFYKLYGKEK